MRRILLAWAGAWLSACGGAEQQFVAWPELDPDAIAFVVSQRQGASTIHGPFLGDGPDQALELEEPEAAYVLALDRAWLRTRHPRVDADALIETRLVTPPSACASCDGACRTTSNERLYHPVGNAGQTWALGEDGFSPFGGSPLSDLDVELPARWACTEQVTTAPLERVESWPREELIRSVIDLGGGRRLAVASTRLTRLDTSPPQTWSSPAGAMRDIVQYSDPNRYLVATSIDAAAGVGSLFELDFSADEIVQIRETSIPTSAWALLVEDRGVIVVGGNGDVLTSTNGVDFTRSFIPFGVRLTSILRVDAVQAPYVIGGNRGFVIWGDPWSPEPGWTLEEAVVTDSSIGQLRMIEAADGRPRELWARTVERGLYFTHPDEVDAEWAKVDVEVPTTFPLCARAADDCGFTRIGERTRDTTVRDRSMLITGESCPVLFVVRPDDGCASTVELRLENGLASEGLGILLEDGSALVVVEDGLVRVPLDGL